jgi:hypothetical protein
MGETKKYGHDKALLCHVRVGGYQPVIDGELAPIFLIIRRMKRRSNARCNRDRKTVGFDERQHFINIFRIAVQFDMLYRLCRFVQRHR